MSKEIRFYCVYCKNPIYHGQARVTDEEGNIYHIDCFNLINTFTDDFGGIYTTDEFGDIDENR